jgi:hypothetical protein
MRERLSTRRPSERGAKQRLRAIKRKTGGGARTPGKRSSQRQR